MVSLLAWNLIRAFMNALQSRPSNVSMCIARVEKQVNTQAQRFTVERLLVTTNGPKA